MKRKVLLVLVLILLYTGAIGATGNIAAFVSIIPQEYFVSRIGGDLVDVKVMVQPGHSPATYEVTGSQLQSLQQAQLYFRIGVPFEEAWMERIQAANPELMVVDTREGIELRPMGSHDDPQARRDPHIWLDPVLVMTQAETIYEALSAVDPDHQEVYQENLEAFLADLEELHEELEEILGALEQRNLMVFHPAWGYLAHRYNLNQMAIEVDGGEPGPRQLARIIEFGRENKIDVIFVQAQFSQETARNVAEEIGAQVISINPLAGDYMDNLRQIVTIIAEELGD